MSPLGRYIHQPELRLVFVVGVIGFAVFKGRRSRVKAGFEGNAGEEGQYRFFRFALLGLVGH